MSSIVNTVIIKIKALKNDKLQMRPYNVLKHSSYPGKF